jgi:hypothetical protein
MPAIVIVLMFLVLFLVAFLAVLLGPFLGMGIAVWKHSKSSPGSGATPDSATQNL